VFTRDEEQVINGKINEDKMNMKIKQLNHNAGLTLIEAIVAMTIIAIAALGSLSYQYFGMKQDKTALVTLTATRLGELVLEDWKSTGGVAGYSPVPLQVGFQTGTAGSYLITVDGVAFSTSLAYNDIATDTTAGVTLRQIAATIRWRNDMGQGTISSSDPSITFTTSVRKDQD
jgi:prepilin-type N-terminal cleavage/methylation domain-containing protein